MAQKSEKSEKAEMKAVEEPTVSETPTASPDPDGKNYVYRDVEGTSVVGYQEQVHKDEA